MVLTDLKYLSPPKIILWVFIILTRIVINVLFNMFSYRSKQMKKMAYSGPRHWSNFPTYFSLIKLCQLNLYEVIQMSWDGSFAWLVIQLLVPVWWKTWKEVEIEGLVRTLCFGFKCLWNSRWEHECTLKKISGDWGNISLQEIKDTRIRNHPSPFTATHILPLALSVSRCQDDG